MAIVSPILVQYVYTQADYSLMDLILLSAIFGILGCYGFAFCVYIYRYSVTVTDTHLSIKYLFTTKTIALDQINRYMCSIYQKSPMCYKFEVFYNTKKAVLTTYKKDELQSILERVILDNNK